MILRDRLIITLTICKQQGVGTGVASMIVFAMQGGGQG